MQSANSLRGHLLSRVLRRAPHYRGMLVIVLWQAPIGPYPRADGGVGILLGGGLDQYVTAFGCDGPSDTESQSYRLAAVEFDHNLGNTVRVEAVGGGIAWEPRASSDWSPGWSPQKSNGVFGQLNLRHDANRWGLGGGVLLLPSMNHNANTDYYFEQSQGYTAKPSAHVRYGAAERLHGRMDLTPPNALGAQVPARLGMGWNATQRDQIAWFVGFAVLGSSPELLGSGLAGEATLPVASRGAVRLLAHYGSGYDKTLSGFAVGGRYTFGARIPPAAADGSDR
jgi:hypothetical protein